MKTNKKKDNKLDIEKCPIPGIDAIGFNIPNSSTANLICCICNDVIVPIMSDDVPPQVIWDGGCNAAPLDTGHGKCCQKCDMTKVLPERLKHHYNKLNQKLKDINNEENY